MRPEVAYCLKNVQSSQINITEWDGCEKYFKYLPFWFSSNLHSICSECQTKSGAVVSSPVSRKRGTCAPCLLVKIIHLSTALLIQQESTKRHNPTSKAIKGKGRTLRGEHTSVMIHWEPKDCVRHFLLGEYIQGEIHEMTIQHHKETQESMAL